MHDWLKRCTHDHPALAGLVVVAAALVATGASMFYVASKVGWFGVTVLGIVPSLALFWRRRAPFVVLGICTVAAIAHWFMQIPVNCAQMTLMLSLYSIARHEPVRSGRIALGVCLALVAISPLRQPYQGPGNMLLQALFIVVVWVLGTNIALRQSYLQALEERAARLERERDSAVRAATLTERTRIAREMHDVVAHHVSVMVVQAEGAGWAMETAPDQARQAVATIAETGRSTLTELRMLLGVLRGGEPGPAEPQPGLADLAELVRRFRLSGLEVEFAAPTELAGVQESVQLAVYRVVQEGLTNVLKHSGVGTRVRVVLRAAVGQVRVEIEDDGGHGSYGSGQAQAVGPGRGTAGRWDPESSSAQGARVVTGLAVDQGGWTAASGAAAEGATGHGLIGIRERAAIFGGGTEIGPLPGQGFRISAWFPA